MFNFFLNFDTWRKGAIGYLAEKSIFCELRAARQMDKVWSVPRHISQCSTKTTPRLKCYTNRQTQPHRSNIYIYMYKYLSQNLSAMYTCFAVGYTAGWAWQDIHGLLFYHCGAGVTLIVHFCHEFFAINMDTPISFAAKKFETHSTAEKLMFTVFGMLSKDGLNNAQC